MHAVAVKDCLSSKSAYNPAYLRNSRVFWGELFAKFRPFWIPSRLAVKKTFLALSVPKLPGFGAGRLEKWPEICVGWSSKRPGSERFRINDDHPKRPQM